MLQIGPEDDGTQEYVEEMWGDANYEEAIMLQSIHEDSLAAEEEIQNTINSFDEE